MKRNLSKWSDVNQCPACAADARASKADTAPDYQPVLATHGVTDAQQQADGSWKETTPRYGCAKHPVVSMVRMLSGAVMTFDEYQKTLEVAA